MNQKHKAVLAGIVIFGAGGGVGHILTKLHLERKLEEQLAEENEKTKHYYRKLHKEGEYSTPEGARQALEEERAEEPMPEEAREAMIRYSGKTVPGVVEPADRKGKRDVSTADIYQDYHEKRRQEAAALGGPETGAPIAKPIVNRNIFSEDHPAVVSPPMQPTFVDDGDARRNGDIPYLMSYDEYNEDRHFTETEVVFYTGDQTVADENDEPIEDGRIDEIFGWDNLAQFGDKFVIHIASPKLGKKYEVTRTDGEFAKMVGGFTDPNEVPEGDSG